MSRSRTSPSNSTLVALLVVALVSTMIFAGLSVWRDYRHSKDLWTERTGVVADLLKSHAQNVFLVADQATQRLGDMVGDQRPEVYARSPDAWHRLQSLADSLPHEAAVFVTDSRGNVVLGVGSFSNVHPVKVNVGDRPYFKAHEAGAPFGISAALTGRITGRWALPVSRRLEDREGRFTGVAVVGLDATYFEQVYRQAKLGALATIGILQTDGRALVLYPLDPDAPGRSYKREALFRDHLPASPSGTFEAVSEADGIDRIWAYRTFDEYPLVVMASLAKAEAFTEWRTRSLAIGIAALVTTVAVTAFFHLARRSLHWEAAAKVRAQTANADLRRTLAELRRTQNQLIHTEKVAALGTMAAGLAHELNNPLMGVMNYVAYARKHPGRAEAAEVLDKAQRELERMRDLLRRTLGFAQPVTTRCGTTWVPEVLHRLIAVLEPDLKMRGIVLHVREAPSLPAVRINGEHLQQVLMNLLLNARDAVRDRAEKYVTVTTSLHDHHVEIEVADTGGGIPDRLRDRIFDPFFTTKAPGEGTGLGLSVSRSLVENVGGALECVSVEGEGARFLVRLQAVKDAGHETETDPGDRRRAIGA